MESNQNTQQPNTTPVQPASGAQSPVAPAPEPVQSEGQPVVPSNTPLQVEGGGKGGKRLLYLAIILVIIVIVFTLVMVGKDLIFKPAQPEPIVTNQQATPTLTLTPTPEVIQNQADLDKTLQQIDAVDPATIGAGLQDNQADVEAFSQ